MKKSTVILSICIFIITIAGCSVQDVKRVSSDSVAEDQTEKTITVKSISGNGENIVQSQVNESEGIYTVSLYGEDEKSLLKTFHIVGRNMGFLWSPDNEKVCVNYYGRIWGNFSTIDTKLQTLTECPTVEFIMSHFKNQGVEFAYRLNQNRPDPYLTPIEWSPDSKKLLVFYVWHDEEYITQNGTFILNVETKEVSDLVQYEPSEGDHAEARIPEGFSW